MKNINYYIATDLDRPKKEDYVRFQINSVSQGTIIEKDASREYLRENGYSMPTHNNTSIVTGDHVVVRIFDEDTYKADLDAFRKEKQDRHQEFKDDLFAENGYGPGAQEAEIIFDRAWENAHSEGYHAVVYEFEGIVEFIEKVKKVNNIE